MMKDRCQVQGCRRGAIYEVGCHTWCLKHGYQALHKVYSENIENLT